MNKKPALTKNKKNKNTIKIHMYIWKNDEYKFGTTHSYPSKCQDLLFLRRRDLDSSEKFNYS